MENVGVSFEIDLCSSGVTTENASLGSVQANDRSN